MEQNRRFILIVFFTLLVSFIIEIMNIFIVKWWYYSNPWTIWIIFYSWVLLGILIATINRKNKNWALGPIIAIWGLIVETLNLSFFHEWYFTSQIGLFGTYIVWVLFGALIYCIFLVSRKFSKKVTS